MLARAVGTLGIAGAAGTVALFAAGPGYEKQLGKACFERQVEAAGRMAINGNEESHKRIARVQERLVAVEPKLGAWTFAMVQSEQRTLLSLPGGFAIFHSGLQEELDDPALDLLIAREMALSQSSRGILALALALAHAALPSAEWLLEAATTQLHTSSATWLAAEGTALSLLARGCFDPTEAPARLQQISRACGSDADDALRRAGLLAALVPAALDEAGAALSALAAAPAGPEGSAAMLLALRDARATVTLLSMVDAGEASDSPRAARLLEQAALIFEKLASEKMYHPLLTHAQVKRKRKKKRISG
ncbi:hypothetical protein T492DRAFT_7794 [Pavlovales sp. CCMP2436]|nr:hypothetical protein T492DRAFT_7794 [Pavlovales sp. CCMP2436]